MFYVQLNSRVSLTEFSAVTVNLEIIMDNILGQSGYWSTDIPRPHTGSLVECPPAQSSSRHDVALIEPIDDLPWRPGRISPALFK